ncbi:Proteophosphoglycan ppg4 [Rhodotorula toruloides ATCC 204091]|uniref:Proteophosphoglycan ppg4 n=1 Tax=Rhodotorula toruloides TaxID=5286 RepID=A0A2T0A5R9_RHOTO|nr:Proteophosphoglycan ppg4 [Rhodotorula toruloides ATCC 204091]PRQ73362.1 Proteophosphoglycan ppg4 [Rhodotorula toruloides]
MRMSGRRRSCGATESWQSLRVRRLMQAIGDSLFGACSKARSASRSWREGEQAEEAVGRSETRPRNREARAASDEEGEETSSAAAGEEARQDDFDIAAVYARFQQADALASSDQAVPRDPEQASSEEWERFQAIFDPAKSALDSFFLEETVPNRYLSPAGRAAAFALTLDTISRLKDETPDVQFGQKDGLRRIWEDLRGRPPPPPEANHLRDLFVPGTTKRTAHQSTLNNVSIAFLLVFAVNAALGGFVFLTSATARPAFFDFFVPMIMPFFESGGRMLISIPASELSKGAGEIVRTWAGLVKAMPKVAKSGGGLFYNVDSFPLPAASSLRAGFRSHHLKEMFIGSSGGDEYQAFWEAEYERGNILVAGKALDEFLGAFTIAHLSPRIRAREQALYKSREALDATLRELQRESSAESNHTLSFARVAYASPPQVADTLAIPDAHLALPPHGELLRIRELQKQIKRDLVSQEDLKQLEEEEQAVKDAETLADKEVKDLLDSLDKKLRPDIKGKGRAEDAAGESAEDHDEDKAPFDDGKEASSDRDEAAGNKASSAAGPKASSSRKSVGKHPQKACDFCKRDRSELGKPASLSSTRFPGKVACKACKVCIKKGNASEFETFEEAAAYCVARVTTPRLDDVCATCPAKRSEGKKMRRAVFDDETQVTLCKSCWERAERRRKKGFTTWEEVRGLL